MEKTNKYKYLLINYSAQGHWSTNDTYTNTIQTVFLDLLRANVGTSFMFYSFTNVSGYYENDYFKLDKDNNLYIYTLQNNYGPTDNFIYRIYGIKF